MSENECPDCRGTGVKVISAPFLDRIDEDTVPCGRCGGTGRTPSFVVRDSSFVDPGEAPDEGRTTKDE